MSRSKSCLRLLVLLVVVLAGGKLHAQSMAFSGELRLRPEFKHNPDYNKATRDTQSFIGHRLRVTATNKFMRNIWGTEGAKEEEALFTKVVVQDARNWGDPAKSNVNGLTDSGEALDLHEVYGELKNLFGLASLRVGRQELVYGDSRHFGNLAWSNQGRAFDALKLMHANEWLNLDAFWAKRKDNNTTALDPNTDKDIYAVFGTVKKVIPSSTLDLYYFTDREGDVNAAGAKPRQVHTLGTRVDGKAGGLDYTGEYSIQTGNNGTAAGGNNVAIKANALAAKLGYTLPVATLRIGSEYDLATGDVDSTDNVSKSFTNRYHTNHIHYGYMDEQAWSNMQAFNINVSVRPAPAWYVYLGLWNFRLDRAQDHWYPATGLAPAAGTFRAGKATYVEKALGNELDLVLRYTMDIATLELGVSRFMIGKAIKERVMSVAPMGTPRDANFSYLMMTIGF